MIREEIRGERMEEVEEWRERRVNKGDRHDWGEGLEDQKGKIEGTQ